jgi:GT2 family glycosyltransferase
MIEANQPLVAISLLNWMNWEETVLCIRSIEHLDYPNYEILVCENVSINDSFQQLKQTFPELTIRRSETNNGYAAGHYQNYLEAKKNGANLFWILNSDLEVDQRALSELVKAYQMNPNGIYGSVSLIPGEEDLVDFGGAELSHLSSRQLTYNSWKGRSYSELRAAHGEVYEVESVEGSSMLIPMAVVEEHGFMHTDFFMYGEETDYCYRMRKNGILSFAVIGSIVYHHNQGSFKFSEDLKKVPAYYRRRNALRFSMDHLGMSKKDALAYLNGANTNLKTVLKGYFNSKKDLNYYYALGCWHAYLGKKGKVVQPEKFL